MPEAVAVSASGFRAIAAFIALAAPGLADAQAAASLAGAQAAPGSDGRLLGHLPYPEARADDLVVAPPGFAIGPPCRIHRDAAPDLAHMLAAATSAPDVGRSLRAVSCFRSVAHQRTVFCRASPRGVCGDPRQRARFVGPPGHSEHATGYAIDFGTRPSPGCPDVDSCIATTPGGRWLLANATRYGFELSFPAGNPQGVTWEPWHWRWVGVTVGAAGAARARLIFGPARATYPASPAVEATAGVPIDPVTAPPPLVFATPLAPAPTLVRRR